jgi:hypothetical protein
MVDILQRDFILFTFIDACLLLSVLKKISLFHFNYCFWIVWEFSMNCVNKYDTSIELSTFHGKPSFHIRSQVYGWEFVNNITFFIHNPFSMRIGHLGVHGPWM